LIFKNARFQFLVVVEMRWLVEFNVVPTAILDFWWK